MMIRKIGIVALSLLLLLCGCQSKPSEEVQNNNLEAEKTEKPLK